MGALTDRPAHKGYPGVVCRSRTFLDFLKDELQRMYDEAMWSELNNFFNKDV